MGHDPQRGFSLVELMIVVSIIGILAALAMPRFSVFQQRARLTEVWTLTTLARADVEEYFRAHGRFPANNEAAGQPAPEKIVGHYVSRVEIENGSVNVHLGNKIAEDLQGKVVSLRPLYVPGSPKSPVSWTCGKGKVPKGLTVGGADATTVEGTEELPGHCR